MKMKIGKISYLLGLLFCVLDAHASINPQATYTENGVEVTDWKNMTADAPLLVRFTSNATDLADGATLEWHIRHKTSGINVTRYDVDTEFTFTEAGENTIALYVRLNNEVIESDSITITITESHLEMPNAFSPNGDGINDFYQAKTNYKSIIDFHAYIFNRHGQKLYDWTDWTDEKKGWDGTYHGSPVKDGVYFVYVKARGADGVDYNIRRDVNLIRHFNETTTTSNE